MSLTTAEITETGDSAYCVSIDVSGYHLTGDEPKAKGGGDLGPAPFDLVCAALGECTAMTVRWYAREHQWPLKHVAVTITHERINKVDHFRKKLVITGPDLSDEQCSKLHDIAARCPVQQMLQGMPVIDTEHRRAEA